VSLAESTAVDSAKNAEEMTRQKKLGFTLVELMVVAIIVVILASVAIPLMTIDRKRSAATEAHAGLGLIRTVLRVQLAETRAYNVNQNGQTVSALFGANGLIGLSQSDLNGHFFSSGAYSLTTITASNVVIQAAGDSSTAPEASQVAGVTVTLQCGGANDGRFQSSGL
jgi:prepilin-type N-terminal cleavage/methylation domain-containing protein